MEMQSELRKTKSLTMPNHRARHHPVGDTLAAIAVVSATLAGSLVVPATSASGTARATPQMSTKGWVFSFVTGRTTDAFYITLRNGAFNYAKTLGIKVTYEGVAEAGEPPSAEVAVVNALLATHPTAMMIAPSNVTALEAPIEAYDKAHIPVICVDTCVDNTKLVITHITSDNYEGGELAAQTIAAEHHDQGQVAIENVPPGISTTDARVAGFEAALKKYPKMSLIGIQNDDGEATLAEAQAKSVILSHPNIVGIFGTNLNGGTGAGDAVVADGDKGKISVVAYDAEPAEVQLLKSGVISVLIVQQPTIEGQDAVKYLYDYLTGKKSLIPSAVLVPNIVATTANANDPDISKYFYESTVAQ
jgi:ribose transport system substrate-binding protein